MRQPHPANLIACPVCNRITGEITNTARGGTPATISYTQAAANPPDGYRCNQHARTEEECIAEGRAAMRWACQR